MTDIARRNDWKTEPMPERHETFVLKRPLSDNEMDALRRGNVPQGEDVRTLNKLLDWWTRPPYDHYGQWLSET